MGRRLIQAVKDLEHAYESYVEACGDHYAFRHYYEECWLMLYRDLLVDKPVDSATLMRYATRTSSNRTNRKRRKKL